MRQSHLFTKTKRESPADELSNSAVLLLQAGFIYKEMAGVYSYLPLGLRVLEKICRIIREEMDAIGGQEVLLSALQEPTVWQTTKRWSDSAVDVWFKTKLKNQTALGLGFTHEEPLTKLMAGYIRSYRDLPRLVYQIQTKFRNETRAKSGIMRCREFLMKDLYSFARNADEHEELYEQVKEAYIKIWRRTGIGDSTYLTFASGGVFAKYSHEFQTIAAAGEDTIYLDEKRGIAVNKEVLSPGVLEDLGLNKKSLVPHRAIEVGNIFSLGTRFSEPLNLFYTDENGERRPVVMGSYGIGPGRVLGTVAELYQDKDGLIWPPAVAPFACHLISLAQNSEEVKVAEALYEKLQSQKIEVLYDDRLALRAGEKFMDSDLIGIPMRLVISKHTLAVDSVEIKRRGEAGTKLVPLSHILTVITKSTKIIS